MAKINAGSFRDWNDGETVKARDYKQEREIMRTAINNTYDRFLEEEAELQQLEVEVRQQGDYALAQGDYAKGQGNAVQEALEKSVNLIKSETQPEGVVEGRLWLDTSNNAYQGTVFEELNTQLAHMATVYQSNGSGTQQILNALNKIKNKGGGRLYFTDGEYSFMPETPYIVDFPLEIVGTEKSIINSHEYLNLFDIRTEKFTVKDIEFKNANVIFDFEAVTTTLKSIKLKNVKTSNIYQLVKWYDQGHINAGYEEFSVINCSGKNNRFHFCKIEPKIMKLTKIMGNKFEDSAGQAFSLGFDEGSELGERERIIFKDNVIRNLHRIGTTNAPVQALIAFAKNIIVQGNIVENISNELANNAEGIYLKAINTVVTDNILINAGQIDAFVTIKGQGRVNPSLSHPSYSHIVSYNVFKSTSITDAQAFMTNAEDVLFNSNILEGRYRYVIELGDAGMVTIENNLFSHIKAQHVIRTFNASGYTGIPLNLHFKMNKLINVSDQNGGTLQVVRIDSKQEADRYSIDGNEFSNIYHSTGSSAARLVFIANTTNYDYFSFSRNKIFNASVQLWTISNLRAKTLEFNDNVGWRTSNSGVAQINAGQTSVTVTHGIEYAPTTFGSQYDIYVTPLGANSGFWVSDITNSNFKINIPATLGVNLSFSWIMSIKRVTQKTA